MTNLNGARARGPYMVKSKRLLKQRNIVACTSDANSCRQAPEAGAYDGELENWLLSHVAESEEQSCEGDRGDET